LKILFTDPIRLQAALKSQ